MKPKIICDTCKQVLEEGDFGARVEEKRCYKCVIATCDKAPVERLLKPASFESNSNDVVKNKEPRLTFCYKWFPPSENSVTDQLRWIVRLETYEKKTLFEITFSKEDLMSVIKDIKAYEFEEKVKKAGLTEENNNEKASD